MGAAANLFCIFLGNIFGAIKRTKYIFISMVISCLVNVGLLTWLIDDLMAQAAALSLMIGCIVNASIRLVLLRRLVRSDRGTN